jgi:hypothetical protein
MKRRDRRLGLLVGVMMPLIGAAPVRDGAVVICRAARPVCDTAVTGEGELARMLVSGDVRVAERLFADDAIWSLSSGERWTKRQAIAALRGAPRMASSQLLSVEVRQFGTTAIVLWHERWRDAAGRDAQAFGTDTWLLRRGRWRIVASQEARPPAR